MDILELVKEAGFDPRRKAASHGGEYCSPCPFCKDGDDRFLIWPQRPNKNGEHQGGRFSCRVCQKYGDAITFLRQYHGLSYKEACVQLNIAPKERSKTHAPRPAPQLPVAEDPPDLWKEKATAFAGWAHAQLMKHSEGMEQLCARGFRDDTLARFNLGYNPQTIFRERPDWGLAPQIKEDGKAKKLWLPPGLVIPTYSGEQVVKVKIRRSEWKEADEWPKYVEISGSKQCLSIFGDASLPGLVLESELDALLIQQEAGDLVYCIALGGSNKPIDAETDHLLRRTPLLLFLPDFDEAGAVAWVKWRRMFPSIHRILTPHEKSAGDYFKEGGNLRELIQDHINTIKHKITED